MNSISFAFLGDDFTGSTDALEGLARNGVRTVLFLETPSPDDLDGFDDLDAIGVASTSRSMTPAEMEETLPTIFDALTMFDPRLIHYKVCSTFDSAPDVGSIGRAIDIAQREFNSPFVPVSQGTTVPAGRYVVFGNLFAEEDSDMYRIDRHPTMRDHPTTPMSESDLQRHLGEQTERAIGWIMLPEIERADHGSDLSLPKEEVVVLDAVATDHLDKIGELVWERAVADGPLFAVGSSGLEHYALPPRWEEAGVIDDTESLLSPQPAVDQLLVTSGSASPVTAAQLDWADTHSFDLIRLDTERLVDPVTASEARSEAVSTALDVINDGGSPLLYTVHGPDDPVIERTRRRYDEIDTTVSIGERLGGEQGRVFRTILEETDLSRACVSGGDTSGFVVPEIDAYALEPLAPTAPGAPLCRVRSRTSAFDGLEITLKGGQTGGETYFESVRNSSFSDPK